MNKLIVAAALAAGLASSAVAEDRTITVTGEGSVEAVPDMATVTLGVTRTAPEAGAALDATSAAIADVIARLEALDIAARDMQTSGLNLQPVWSQPGTDGARNREITGFSASNRLTVRVRALETLGTVLNETVQEGANTFDGLRFSLQDPDTAIAAARADAVRDAKTRATQIAEAASVQLGPVLSISEETRSPRPVAMEMASARMSDSVPVAAGEVSLTVTVSARFAIAEE